MDHKQTAKELYLTIYKATEEISFELSLSIAKNVVDKVIQVTPEQVFASGLIGKDINPQHEFWTKVKYELQRIT